MLINIEARNLDLTESLKVYIEKKLGVLSKVIKKFELASGVEIKIEISRTTRHHRKGGVFSARVDLILPGKIIRSRSSGTSIREAVDILENKLFREAEKYKELSIGKRAKTKSQ